MAMQTLPTFLNQSLVFEVNAAVSVSGLTVALDSTGDKQAIVFRVTPDLAGKQLRSIGFRTGTNVAGTIDIAMKTVDEATGLATATAFTDSGTVNSGALSANTQYFKQLSSDSRTLVLGERFAIVFSSADISGTINFSGSTSMNTVSESIDSYPLFDNNTGTYSKTASTMIISCMTSDGVYHRLANYLATGSLGNISLTASKLAGLRFKVLFKARIIGFRVLIDADDNLTLKMYDTPASATPTLLGSATIDKDCRGVTTTSLTSLYLDTSVVISPDTYYRIVFLSNSSSGALPYLDYLEGASTNFITAAINGENFHYTEYASATPPSSDSSWTNTLYRVPWISPIYDQLDDGVSSGSSTCAHWG